jgi:hypothetical protein
VLESGVQVLRALAVDHVLAQHPEPLVARRLRHDVLDGELRGGEVDRFGVLVALLQPLEHHLALVPAAELVEGRRLDLLAQLVVIGPEAVLGGEELVQPVSDRHVERELPGHRLKDPVEVVRRHPAHHPAHQEALDVRHRAGRVRGVKLPAPAPVEQQQKRGIGDLGLPGVQPVQMGADRFVRLFLGVEQPTEEGASPVQLLDVRLDLRLADLTPLEALLLSRVEVLAADPVVPVEHQLKPHELFQLVVAQTVLQRKPVGLVDVLTAGGQPHEQVVAQQVGLAQLEAGVVEGLEDAVHVVCALGCHRHQREPGGDGLLDAEHVLRGGRIGGLDELAAEEAVGGGDGSAGGLLRERPANVCRELRPVSLGRQ